MNVKLIIFDLDGTLTESKCNMTLSMGRLLSKLSKKYKIGVISGASLKQFKSQFVKYLPVSTNFTNLYILPMNGSELLKGVSKKNWKLVYSKHLSKNENLSIKKAFEKTLSEINYKPKKICGPLLEYRGGQVTFSALGMNTPVLKKKKWDPDQKKRKKIVRILKKHLKNFEIGIGGTTSIDVTKKGITKAYGVGEMLSYVKLKKTEAVFFGDAVFPGGNDSSVKLLGVKSLRVFSPRDTEKFIRKFISV